MVPPPAFYEGHHFCYGDFVIGVEASYLPSFSRSHIYLSYYKEDVYETHEYRSAFPWAGESVSVSSIVSMLNSAHVPSCIQTLYAVYHIYNYINECILSEGYNIQLGVVPIIDVSVTTVVSPDVSPLDDDPNYSDMEALIDIELAETAASASHSWDSIPMFVLDYIPRHQPASINAVNSLDVGQFCTSLGDNCVICLEGVDGSLTLMRMPCLHLFHPECICTWLQHKHSCPICRFKLPC